jgi:hypothetical protein
LLSGFFGADGIKSYNEKRPNQKITGVAAF